MKTFREKAILFEQEGGPQGSPLPVVGETPPITPEVPTPTDVQSFGNKAKEKRI